MPGSFPKRADHFKKWSQMMLEQAIVPERLEYKGHSASTKKSNNGGITTRRKRRKRFLRRKRKKQQE